MDSDGMQLSPYRGATLCATMRPNGCRNRWGEEVTVNATEFGRRVRRAAAAKYPRHLREELAQSAGVSTSTVAKLFGSRPPWPTPRTVIALARALEWDVNETLAWLGYEPLTDEAQVEVLASVPSMAERLKVMLRAWSRLSRVDQDALMLRAWCQLSRSDQDALMREAALLESRGSTCGGTGVTLFEADAEVRSDGPRCVPQGHG